MSRRPATARPPRCLQGIQPCEDQVLRRALREEVLSLPVPAFDRLMARLLEACGYEEVEVLGEARGGADLSASTRSGLCCVRTLVQAKQYASPVSRRFVDELRGAMLRHGAGQGLLLTTSTFYGPARRAARRESLLPVRLVEGRELLDLLLRHRLGVRSTAAPDLDLDEEPEPAAGLELDREFFVALGRERVTLHKAPAGARGRPPAAPASRHFSCPCCGALVGPCVSPCQTRAHCYPQSPGRSTPGDTWP